MPKIQRQTLRKHRTFGLSSYQHISTQQSSGKMVEKAVEVASFFPLFYRILYNIVWDFFHEQ